MKIEVRYNTRLTKCMSKKPSYPKRVLHEIGATYSDAEARLSECFKVPVRGLTLADGGVRFEYDATRNRLYSIAIFFVDTLPSEQQMQALIEQTTDQLDYDGYYGVDGWFIDLYQGFYLHLVAPHQRRRQPVSVSVDGKDMQFS